jgi:hypothetical protein
MHRRSRAGEVEDAIDFEQHRLDHIMAQQYQVRLINQMRDVAALATEKIVEADYFMPFIK